MAAFWVSAAAPASAQTFSSEQRGAVAGASFGTSAVGDALLGELGGEWAALETVAHSRLLLQWDGLITLKGGLLGQTHPYTRLFGGRASGFGEAGYRFSFGHPWSLYAGARMAAETQILARLGVGLSQLRTVNNVAGVGGINAGGALRLAVGASRLTLGSSLLLTGFVQESARLAQANLPGATFTDVGVAARFDLPNSLMLAGEALWGKKPTSRDALLGRSDETTHVGVATHVRKVFANGMWLGAHLSLSRESDAITYAASHTHYATQSAPGATFLLLFGFPLGGP